MGTVAQTLTEKLLDEARRSAWGLLPTLVRERNGKTYGPYDFLRALEIAEELPHEIERAELVVVGETEFAVERGTAEAAVTRETAGGQQAWSW